VRTECCGFVPFDEELRLFHFTRFDGEWVLFREVLFAVVSSETKRRDVEFNSGCLAFELLRHSGF